MKRIHIFSTGKHTANDGQTLSFDETHLAGCAAVYNPELHESPLVIGHPHHNLPAYGWVKGLEFADGGLSAIPDQVNPEFEEMVVSGAFKKISASFYKPDAPNNPTPGHLYLRHVGFLGAQPPAVKGLKPIEFSDDAENDHVFTVEFGEINPRNIALMMRGMRDWILGKFGQEDADKALPGWDVQWISDQAAIPEAETATPSPAFSETPEPSPTPKPAPTPKEDTVTDEELKAREAEIAKREASFAETQARASAVEFADGLIRDGKLVPAQKDQVVSLATHLAVNAEGEISFAEGTPAVAPLDAFKAILGAAPKAVDFSEHSAADADGSESVDFSDPVQLASKATAYRSEQSAKGITVSHSQAVRHVQKEAGK